MNAGAKFKERLKLHCRNFSATSVAYSSFILSWRTSQRAGVYALHIKMIVC